jgi:hypothetical protein
MHGVVVTDRQCRPGTGCAAGGSVPQATPRSQTEPMATPYLRGALLRCSVSYCNARCNYGNRRAARLGGEVASDEDRYRILSELRGGDVDVSVERRAEDGQRFGELGCW